MYWLLLPLSVLGVKKEKFKQVQFERHQSAFERSIEEGNGKIFVSLMKKGITIPDKERQEYRNKIEEKLDSLRSIYDFSSYYIKELNSNKSLFGTPPDLPFFNTSPTSLLQAAKNFKNDTKKADIYLTMKNLLETSQERQKKMDEKEKKIFKGQVTYEPLTPQGPREVSYPFVTSTTPKISFLQKHFGKPQEQKNIALEQEAVQMLINSGVDKESLYRESGRLNYDAPINPDTIHTIIEDEIENPRGLAKRAFVNTTPYDIGKNFWANRKPTLRNFMIVYTQVTDSQKYKNCHSHYFSPKNGHK
jgi:hypothetical protein